MAFSHAVGPKGRVFAFEPQQYMLQVRPKSTHSPILVAYVMVPMLTGLPPPPPSLRPWVSLEFHLHLHARIRSTTCHGMQILAANLVANDIMNVEVRR